MDYTSLAIFIIVAFCFALIIIMKREAIPASLRRPLALLAIVMVVFAFGTILYSLFNLG